MGNPHKQYTTEWFRHEFPEDVGRRTQQQWRDLMLAAYPEHDTVFVLQAADFAFELFGGPGAPEPENEFGPVSP